MSAPKRGVLRTCSLAVLLAWFGAWYGAAAAVSGQGAIPSDRLTKLVEHTLQQPGKRGTLVTFIVESDAPVDAIAAPVSSEGGKLPFHFGNRYEIRISAARVQPLLMRLPPGSHARLPWPHQAVATVISQGVAVTGANDMQLLGHTGAGLKIGIIDLQFTNLQNSKDNGELPADTDFTDYTGTGSGGGSHGTNVAEIVHDMAPGAKLYLAKIDTELELQQAVTDMIAAGVRVINHSVAWFGAAFYDGTGPLCDITDSAESAGILWANAAGNSRNAHYLGTFTDTDGDQRHEFAAGQNYNTITLATAQTITLVLNWDAYSYTNTDYDLYLYNGIPGSGGTLVASSENTQSVARNVPPYESIAYAASAGTYYIVVTKKKASTPNVRLTLFSLGPALGTKTQSSSLTEPADCASVLAAGATYFDNDSPEGFSSEGPTTDGRAKPEISAPDGVATSLTSKFSGTSAASPHAAGAAALIMAAHPGYSVAQVRNELAATAKDLSTTGFDYRTGFGRISLDADGDGLNHDLETAIGTNPLAVDTDSDGLTDYEEVAWDGDASSYTPGSDLDPLAADTDDDGLTDYQEVDWDSSPAFTPGSDPDPLVKDTDADGFADGMEYFAGYDPLNPASFPVWGDINDDRRVDTADVLLASRAVLGLVTLSDAERARGKVAPLVNDTPEPPSNGPLTAADLLLIERMALGMLIN